MAMILTISISACSPEQKSEESNSESSLSSEISGEMKLTKESEYFAYDEISESAFKADKGEFGFISAENNKRHEGFVNDNGDLNCRTHNDIDNSYILEETQITIKIDGNNYILQKVDKDMYTRQLEIIRKKIKDSENSETSDESSVSNDTETSEKESSDEKSSNSESSEKESSAEQQESKTETSKAHSSSGNDSSDDESSKDLTADWDPYNIDTTSDYTGSALGDYGSINGSEYYGDFMLHINKNRASISVMMKINSDHVDINKLGGYSMFFNSYPVDYFKQPNPGEYWFEMDMYPSATKTGSPLHISMGKEPISRDDGTYYWVTHCHIVYEDYSNDVDFYRSY